MKAMRAHQFGGPDLLRLEDVPAPQVLPGQVQIRVRAAGVNPADLVRLSGRLQPLPLPYTPGTDVCGEVLAVGAGVTHVKEGERVFGRALSGGYAEQTCLAASEAIPLPANLSFEEGAAIPIPFYTAYHAIHHKAVLKAGETVLISAGGGGVGVAAIQLAKMAGAPGPYNGRIEGKGRTNAHPGRRHRDQLQGAGLCRRGAKGHRRQGRPRYYRKRHH